MNYARAGIQYTYQGANTTVYGDWIYPIEIKWHNVYVTTCLTDITAIKIIINGGPNFKAWIDQAYIAIYTTNSLSSAEGDLSIAAQVYQWKTDPRVPGFPDGEAKVSTALYAQSKGDYRIRNIELKVELLPNDGTHTTQQASMHIHYAGQANDKGYEIDPAKQEEFHNEILSVGELVLDIFAGDAIAIVITALMPPPGGAPIAMFLGWMTSIGIYLLYRAFASDPYHPSAPGGSEYSIWENWDYPS
jgi:hypothetical protein